MQRSGFASFFSSRYTADVKGAEFLKARRVIFFAAALLLPMAPGLARTPVKTSPPNFHSATPANKMERQDDSIVRVPAKDLMLQPAAARKADALAQFVEGERWEELGEMEKALESYQKVLNVDPARSTWLCTLPRC